MSEVNEILKKVTASIEDATSKFNAKAEEALTEAKKNGQLSAQTKDVVDKMATTCCPDAAGKRKTGCRVRWPPGDLR